MMRTTTASSMSEKPRDRARERGERRWIIGSKFLRDDAERTPRQGLENSKPHTYPERVAMDMRYIDSRGVRLDLALLARTALVVLRGRGA